MNNVSVVNCELLRTNHFKVEDTVRT